jgi:hypothetical protein
MDDPLLILFGIVFVVGVTFYVVFFLWAFNNLGGDIDWNRVKSNVFSAWISPLAAILFTFIALFYFIRFPNYSVYIAMGLSCLAVGLSAGSLSYAVVSR